ncbi:MAG: hypothetical protein ACI9NQ_001532 [Paracoccaceae bacterium]|jgi:hypothetical protein
MKPLLLFLGLVWFASAQEIKEEGGELEESVENPNFDKAGEILWNAQQEVIKKRAEIEANYRNRLAEAFRLVDRAEIMLLDFNPILRPTEEGGKEFTNADAEAKFGKDTHFFIKPYGAYSKILKKKEVGSDLLKGFRSGVIEMFKEPVMGPGPFCHYPIHGIRLYIEGELFFETSLCWHCGNYFMSMTGAWDGMWVGFKGEKLEAFLKKEMPIPQSEIDRFKEQHGR